MTIKEAIECNKNLRMYMKLSDKNQPYKFLEDNYIALDMGIEALERESKMLSEINHLHKYISKLETQIVEQEPCDKCIYSTKDGCCQYDDIIETIPPFELCN